MATNKMNTMANHKIQTNMMHFFCKKQKTQPETNPVPPCDALEDREGEDIQRPQGPQGQEGAHTLKVESKNNEKKQGLQTKICIVGSQDHQKALDSSSTKGKLCLRTQENLIEHEEAAAATTFDLETIQKLWTPGEQYARWGALIAKEEEKQRRHLNGVVFNCRKAMSYQYDSAFKSEKIYPSVGNRLFLDGFRSMNWSRKTELQRPSEKQLTRFSSNMLFIVKQALGMCGHLLTCDEKLILQNFLQLETNYQRLFSYLYVTETVLAQRLGSIEVDISEQDIRALEAAGFIECVLPYKERHFLSYILSMCQDDKAKVAALLKIDTSHDGSKVDGLIKSHLKEAILEEDAIQALREVTGTYGKCSSFASATMHLAHIALLASSGYTSEEAASLLHSNLTATRFPSQELSVSKVFETRNEIEDFRAALALSDAMEAAVIDGNGEWAYGVLHFASTLLMEQTRKKEVIHQLIKVVYRGVSLLEREKKYSEALHYLDLMLGCPACSGNPALNRNTIAQMMLRYAIDCEHLGCKEEALLMYEKGAGMKDIALGIQLSFQQGISKLAVPPRRWKPVTFQPLLAAKEVSIKGRRTSNGWVLADTKGGKEKGGSVEQLVLEYYKGKGYQGYHSENGTWLSLFSLILWEKIYDTSIGALMDYPLVLNDDCIRNELAIIRDLDGSELKSKVKRSWNLHHGLQGKFHSWDAYNCDFLANLAMYTPSKCLAAVFSDILRNNDQHVGGYPDLVMFNPFRREVKYVEVKGPGDSLHNRQKAAIHRLVESGANVEVCHVIDAD